jgi:phospholipase/lecithinase/hemolysin
MTGKEDMMRIEDRIVRLAAIFCVSILGLAPVGGFARDGFDGIFIFGDSLSDPGNAYALTGETSKTPYAPIPAAA